MVAVCRAPINKIEIWIFGNVKMDELGKLLFLQFNSTISVRELNLKLFPVYIIDPLIHRLTFPLVSGETVDVKTGGNENVHVL